MKPLFTLFLLVHFVLFAHAQLAVNGWVTDKNGTAIPFASIYKRNTSTGTSANSEGVFHLSLPMGSHTLTISAVGYQPATVQINLPHPDSLHIQLVPATYALQEVIIGSQEDPAYAIIRKAIQKRPHYLSQSNPYTAHVYIKGLQRLMKAPKKFFGVDIEEVGKEMGLDSNRRGIIYLSESESKITVRPPNDFREEMISSKVSGNNRAFSFNRAADLQLNFYENHQDIIEGLSSRPFLSPIADQALAYYRYQYLGSRQEGNLIINKIKVIPRRKAEPLYSGVIYIIENDWRIHSVDLLLDKTSSINFVDSLHIKQLFVPVKSNLWLPANVQLDFKAGLFGFHIGGYFTAIYQDYTLIDPPSSKFFNEVLAIGKDVNNRDSTYWSNHRPIPLTSEEQQDYIAKDSLRKQHESKAYLDSVDQQHNRFKPWGFLTGGYNYRNRYRKTYVSLSSPLTSLLFNSVEGLAVNYGFNYSKEVDSSQHHYLRINGRIRYGFANKRLQGVMSARIPFKNQYLTVSGGRDMVDLNSRGSIPVLFNSLYTLFMGENYQKLYEKTFVSGLWNYTLPGNIRTGVQVEWANRHWLPNATNFTFWERNQHKLTANNPFLPDADVPLFVDNQSTKIRFGIQYDFSNRYETYPSGKRYLPSKYPTFALQYTKGLKNVFGSDIDYDLLTASLYKSHIALGLYGHLSATAIAGKFLRNNQLFYPDFHHFNGNQILFVDQQLSSFLALDYYQYSTDNHFVEAHTEYNMGGLITSRVPLLRKLKLEELIGLHYVHTSQLRQYGELHLGLQWKVLRIIYAHSKSSIPLLDGTNTIRIGLKLF